MSTDKTELSTLKGSSLPDALVRLASDLPNAAGMGAAGRSRALAQFLQERCTDRTELLYRQAIGGRTAGP